MDLEQAIREKFSEVKRAMPDAMLLSLSCFPEARSGIRGHILVNGGFRDFDSLEELDRMTRNRTGILFKKFSI